MSDLINSKFILIKCLSSLVRNCPFPPFAPSISPSGPLSKKYYLFGNQCLIYDGESLTWYRSDLLAPPILRGPLLVPNLSTTALGRDEPRAFLSSLFTPDRNDVNALYIDDYIIWTDSRRPMGAKSVTIVKVSGGLVPPPQLMIALVTISVRPVQCQDAGLVMLPEGIGAANSVFLFSTPYDLTETLIVYRNI